MSKEDDILDKLDCELLRGMLVELKAYRPGRGRFPGLVSALDVGIDALVESEPAVLQALREGWRVLEEINALALDQGRLDPLADDKAAAETAMGNLEAVMKAQFAVLQENSK